VLSVGAAEATEVQAWPPMVAARTSERKSMVDGLSW
jgi:hypothetical protein